MRNTPFRALILVAALAVAAVPAVGSSDGPAPAEQNSQAAAEVTESLAWGTGRGGGDTVRALLAPEKSGLSIGSAYAH